jgi:D-proline reductase (dithiol) PrdB
LSRSRIALVTTAGLVAPQQPRFSSRIGGDPDYRILDAAVRLGSLIDCHRSEAFDHRGVAADANVAFPLDRLRELAAAGRIGEVAPRHLSFMGSLTLTGALRRRTAPEAAARLVDDRVDIALLVPV